VSPEFDRSPEPIIRETSIDDIVSVRKMQAQSWIDTYPNAEQGVSMEWVRDLTDSWLTPDGFEKSISFMSNIIGKPNNLHCVAVDNNGKVAGCVHVSCIDNNQILEALYVEKKYHGKGVAQKLMNQAMGWIDLSKPIQLEVTSYNDRAIAFYQKYGFKIEEGSEHKFQDVMPTLNMIRKGDKK